MKKLMNLMIVILLLSLICTSCTQTEKSFIDSKDAYFGLTPPGLIPEVFAPGIVSDSTWAEHCQVAISPKGDEIYWSAWSSKYPAADGKGNTEQIYFSQFINGSWTKPGLAEFTIDNKHGRNGGPVFSLDGTKLFFYQRKPSEKYMYYVEKTNGKWSDKPINVGKPYNTKTGDLAANWTPVFTNKGNAYKYGQGKRVIIKYKYEGTTFSNPDTFTIYKDFRKAACIFVSPDEEYVIFAAVNSIGYGGTDLYICFKAPDDTWGYPINMGSEINSELVERFPMVSPDGKYLFFVRHTPGQDFFWVSTDIIKNLKTQSLNN